MAVGDGLTFFAPDVLSEVLGRYIHDLGIMDGIFILGTHSEKGGHALQNEGLDKALSYINDGRPIVVISILRPRELRRYTHKRYFALLGHQNVEFADAIPHQGEWLAAYERARDMVRMPDPLAIALLGLSQTENKIGVLRHDTGHYDKSKWSRCIPAARVLGITGTDEEVIAKVMDTKAERGLLTGQTFSGVFVDLEGTLVVDGQINQELLAWMAVQSQTQVVKVWTGSSVADAIKNFAEAIPYQITSKANFRDVNVGIVIDNESQADQVEAYGYKSERYILYPNDPLPE